MTRTELVAAYLRERPNVWIDLREIATVGGFYAARTRLSEARTVYGMQIDNRVRRVGAYAVSEYRYTPKVEPVQADLWGAA